MKTAEDSVSTTDSPILTHGTRPWYNTDDYPGEYVLRHSRETSPVRDNEFEFAVKRVIPTSDEDNHGKPYYIAVNPYRAIVCTGETVESAVSGMIFYLITLARNGSINPKYLSEPGDPPIQHVLGVLSERLLWQTERRHEHLGKADTEVPKGHEDKVSQDQYLANVARDNEIISALATSIAALARVKDL